MPTEDLLAAYRPVQASVCGALVVVTGGELVS
jgi:hypothetical protein